MTQYSEDIDTWAQVTYNTNDIDTVFDWLQEHIDGDFSLSITTIHFMDPVDATFFKLSFKDDISPA